MTTHNTIKLLILGLILSVTSCQPYYYAPLSQNVLKFKDKGDVTAAYSYDEHEFNSYSLGYSITNNIALNSNFTRSSSSSAKYNIDDYLWDNELVLYKKIMNNIYPAINFGYGFGQIDRNSTYYQLDINRQFMQPSLGFSNNFFDIAISSRLSRVHYDLSKINDYNVNPNMSFEEHFDLRDVGKTDFYFFEPALTIGLGYKYAKLRFQVISIDKLSSGKISYVDENWSLTLHLTFNAYKLLAKKQN